MKSSVAGLLVFVFFVWNLVGSFVGAGQSGKSTFWCDQQSPNNTDRQIYYHDPDYTTYVFKLTKYSPGYWFTVTLMSPHCDGVVNYP